MLRPEDLRLTAGGDAEVELVAYSGHDTVYVVRPLSGPPLRLRAASAPEHERGASVSVPYQGQDRALSLPLPEDAPGEQPDVHRTQGLTGNSTEVRVRTGGWRAIKQTT